jgi:hypothetical protein
MSSSGKGQAPTEKNQKGGLLPSLSSPSAAGSETLIATPSSETAGPAGKQRKKSVTLAPAFAVGSVSSSSAQGVPSNLLASPKTRRKHVIRATAAAAFDEGNASSSSAGGLPLVVTDSSGLE